ncbi:MAG: SUMF1/EgtB/PvdO family nonheme iron enzyme [Opitutae bacterium]|nr:SUMF1/EgtB/PvdO family nonheme iron enzyme [Opitutae bacterium]
MPLKQWVKTAVVRKDDEWTLFINGEKKYTVTNNSVLPKGHSLRIGKLGTDASDDWHGLLDDIRIYDRALSADEVRTLYKAEAPPVTIESHTYTLVKGDGDMDNESFTVVDDKLMASETFDFEGMKNLSVRVRSTDAEGLFVEKALLVTVTNANDPPSNILLAPDPSSVMEGEGAGTEVGTLSAVDPDLGATFGGGTVTFPRNLEEGLVAYYPFNGNAEDESGNSHDGTVNGATPGEDRFGGTDRAYNFDGVDDFISLGVGSSINTAVHSFSISLWCLVDQELNHASSILDQGSDSKSGRDIFKTASDLKNIYTYAGGHRTLFAPYQKGRWENFTFSYELMEESATRTLYINGFLTAQDEIPYPDPSSNNFIIGKDVVNPDLHFLGVIDDVRIYSRALIDAEVLQLFTVESSASLEESHTFELVPGTGDTQNSNFQIVGDKLQVKNALTAITTPTASVRVKATDASGESLEKAFTITVQDKPDPPTAITLSPSKVKEKMSPGSTVGSITVTDADTGDTHVLELVEGELDNDSFFMQEDGTLLTNDFLLLSDGATRQVRVLVTDSAGLTLQEDLTITIEQNDPSSDFFLTVNREPSSGGLVAGMGYYNDGDVATLAVTPARGYSFAGFTGDLPGSGASAENPLPLTIDGDKTLTAHFTPSYHKVMVQVEPEGHGYAWGGGTFLHGESITLMTQELDPRYGCPFTHWSVNGTKIVDNGDENPLVLKLEVDRPLVVKAHFDYGLNEKMKPIPGGKFDMGYIRNPNERPVHAVDVSGFYAHETEVTKAEWMEVFQWALQNGYQFDFDPRFPMGRNRAVKESGYKDDFPITGISWFDGVKWCNARSEKENMTPAYYIDREKTKVYRRGGPLNKIQMDASMVDWRAKGYRLPTEAEWEKAARGGITGMLYPNGPELDSSFALYEKGRGGQRVIQSVGKLEPNGFGLHDTIGNAWEMCFDWFWKNWYAQPESSLRNTSGPELDRFASTKDNAIVRVVRGGSGNADDKQCTVSYRKDFNKTWFQYSIGLRTVVPSPDEPTHRLKLKAHPPFLGTAAGSGYYAEGTTASIMATPAENRGTFIRWEDEDGNVLGTQPNLDLIVDADKVLTAVFEQSGNGPSFYALETFIEPQESGTVSGGGAYLAGTVATLTATPGEGVDFAGWSGDVSGTNNPGTVTMNGHKMVYLYFGDTKRDTDKDGLSDVYEKSIGTLTDDPDTDRDSLPDGREVNELRSNPLLIDTDEDGFSDKDEAFYGTLLTDPNDFPFMEREAIGLYSTFRGKPADSSPKKKHGKAVNVSAKNGRNGKGRNAFYYNGNDANITFPYKGVDGAMERAFSIWVRGTESAPGAALLVVGKDSGEFSLQLDDGGSGAAQVIAGGITVTGTTPLLDGNWHQVTVSLDKGGTIGDIAIYVDGAAETLILGGSAGTVLNTKAGGVTLGSRGNKDFFKGYIDDIRYYERSLHASEVQKLFKLEEPTAVLEPETLAPQISQHPTHKTLATGGSATFSVTATAKPDPVYQWQKQVKRKWVDIKEETGTTLSLTNATTGDSSNYRVVVSNSLGERNSKTARLMMLDPPVFTAQPADALFAIGSNASLLIEVAGSKTLRYQWFKNGAEIPKATKNKLTLRKVTAARDNGTYQVEVENAVGKATSDEFNISIIRAVEITAHPEDAAFIQGQPAQLSVTATGEGTLAYQWEKLDSKTRKWTLVDGANSPTLSIADMQEENVGDYRCWIDNVASRASSKAGELEMYIVPTIKTQPRSASVNEGSKVSLKALANGDPEPSYQWEELNGDGVTWDPIPKANKPELTFSKAKSENSGKYRVKAVNGGGEITSDEADLIIYYAPKLTTQPVATSVNEGDAVNLTVVAESLDSKGTTSTYTWYKDKQTVKDADGVSGSRSADLSISEANAGSYGTYYCVIKNGVGSVKSKTAKVSVLLKPYSTKELKSLSLIEGKTATFSASIQGGKPITFKWQKDGGDISGENKNKLSRRGVKASDAGTYSIIATNAAGSLTLSAELTVAAAATDAVAGFALNEASRLSAVEDADGDGMSNLLEHALGSDPASNGSTHSPIVDSVEDGSGDIFISFSYSENKSATGITYIVERSTDLKTWEPFDLSNASVNRLDRGTFTEVTVFIPATEGSGFYRVRIE